MAEDSEIRGSKDSKGYSFELLKFLILNLELVFLRGNVM